MFTSKARPCLATYRMGWVFFFFFLKFFCSKVQVCNLLAREVLGGNVNLKGTLLEEYHAGSFLALGCPQKAMLFGRFLCGDGEDSAKWQT